MSKAKKQQGLKVIDENKIDEILNDVDDPKSHESLDPVESELKASYEKEKKEKKNLKNKEHKRFDKFKGEK